MCNRACLDFGRRQLTAADVAGRRVLEVGSRVVQSPDLTLRHHLESLRPASLLGVDREPGPGVDRVLDAGDLVAALGAESFDVVVCTELVEHVRDWRRVFHNLKAVLRRGGVLLLTTRSPGFPYHAFPHDYWRFTPDDLRAILADMRLEAIERDPSSPGVLVKARKPADFAERDLVSLGLLAVFGGARRRRPPSLARLVCHRVALRLRGFAAALR